MGIVHTSFIIGQSIRSGQLKEVLSAYRAEGSFGLGIKNHATSCLRFELLITIQRGLKRTYLIQRGSNQMAYV